MTRRVIVLEDDESLRLVITKALSRAGFHVRATASPDTAIAYLARNEGDALVADVLLGNENFLERLDDVRRIRPDAPVIVISAQTTAATAIGANLAGAFEYLPKPFDINELVASLGAAFDGLSIAPKPKPDLADGLIGRSPAMQAAFKGIGRLARSQAPVLITGPDGSGKAAAGRMLHRQGRSSAPLVEAGPQRFAAEAAELWAAARGGTLLLRRAEDWSSTSQDFIRERLEGEAALPFRLVATAGVEVEKRLPGPLFELLAVGRIEMPPLECRGSDRVMLFKAFLNEENPDLSLSPAAADFINAQPWPGEVQQLKRVARHIGAQTAKTIVDVSDVRAALPRPQSDEAEALVEDAARRYFAQASMRQGNDAVAETAQAALERGLIRAALSKARGVRLEAARMLGMNRNTFARKLSALDQADED